MNLCTGSPSEPFKDDKGEDVTKYIKEGYLQCKRRNGQKWLCSIPGRSSSDLRKIKILSKHLLPQGEGVLARASLIGQGTMQA